MFKKKTSHLLLNIFASKNINFNIRADMMELLISTNSVYFLKKNTHITKADKDEDTVCILYNL